MNRGESENTESKLNLYGNFLHFFGFVLVLRWRQRVAYREGRLVSSQLDASKSNESAETCNNPTKQEVVKGKLFKLIIFGHRRIDRGSAGYLPS